MSPELQQRIQNLLGDEPVPMPMEMAEGGEVSREEMMMQAAEGVAEGQANPDEAIRSSIEELMVQASQTEDPSERDQYLHLAEAAEIGAEAPMAQAAKELAQAGRGEDTHLAHLRAGEVVIPPEAFEDEEFEGLIEKKFRELDIDPKRMVVGVGIASLNPITGLEEFGFFKKLAKSVKKVVKKVVKPLAKFAQFLPPPVGPVAALANKAFTVYDVAKGRASPLALLTMGKGAPGGSLAQNFADVTKSAGSGGFFSSIGKGLGSLVKGGGADGIGNFGRLGDFVGGATKGIGGLFMGGGKDGIGSFGRMGDFLGGIGDATGLTNYAGMTVPGYAGGQFPIGEGETAQEAMMRYYNELPEDSPERQYIAEQMQLIREDGTGVITAEEIMAHLNAGSGGSASGQGGFGGLFSGGGADGKGNYGIVGDVLGGLFSGSGSGSGGGLNLGGIGGAGIAAVLAKLAYDEAKNRRGIQLTPAMTMNRYGGYQMAKRDAEAAGEAAPDPIDYGLLPAEMPLLSGGRQAPVQEEQPEGMRYGGAVMPQQMRYGGMVPMFYAEGGNVATEDFKRKNGGINGEGTETSDDIPAMLSDGEFVMTGQAVRGAGSFDLQNDGGIITLTPNGGESREKGTQLMYEMMELFAEFADKPKPKRAKAA